MSPSAAIQAAWAILIGLTLNTEDVSFVLQELEEVNVPNHKANEVIPGLGRVETTLYRDQMLVELLNILEARPAAGDSAYKHYDTCPCILQVSPCLEGQGATDTVSKQNGESHADARLVVSCVWSASDLSIIGRYDDAVLQPGEVNRMLDQFIHLLGVLTASDDSTTLGQLQICGPSDLSQIRQWNSSCPERVMKLAHDIITSQANRRPDALAVSAWDAQFTYRELESFSETIAQRLLSLGVQPDSLVPFCFEKSAWAIVAMIGILKAGAAFVALDPMNPLERLNGIVQRIGTDVLLTSEASFERLRMLAPNTIVVSQLEVTRLAKLDQSRRLLSSVTPSNLAYVIFTSGSTGTPKGVMVEHHSLAQSCLTLGTQMGSVDETRMLQFSSFTFDASVLEIFPTLFHGGCICMPSDSDRVDNLEEYINNNNVDLVFLTPSIAAILDPTSIPKVHTLVTGGEAFSGDTMKSWLENRIVMNAYGPSEITIACNMTKLTVTHPSKCIGHAISTISWIVDPEDHNRLMPVGCVGELLVQGHTLARGYFQDEEKTASLFIEAPAWYDPTQLPDAPTRLYKTGDLVRYEPDGSLLYVGRKDAQVKVRGQRVELEEIEHHLTTNGMVSQALALFPSSGFLKHQIVGILVLEEEAKVNFDGEIRLLEDEAATRINKIRSSLSELLPSYMVPGQLIAVQSLPLLPSGKVNRKSLAQWIETIDKSILRAATAQPQSTSANTPVSDIVLSLQQIVGDVLNIPVAEVHLQQSFLSLGGDSISAMQIVTRCRTQGMDLATRNVLRSSSISEMALHVTSSKRPTIQDWDEEENGAIFALSPMQKLYFGLVPSGDNEFNQSFLLNLRGQIDDEILDLAIKAVVERHSMLRARFTHHEGEWVQYISKDTESSYRLISHRVSGPEITPDNMPHSAALVNAETGPLLVADLITADTGDRYLRLTAHHLVIDLVSWRIILHDLEEYFKRGMLVGGKPLPFQSWLHFQDEYTSSAVLPPALRSFEDALPELQYWGITELPLSKIDNHTHSFTLSADLTEEIMKGCHSSLRTNPVDIMLASLLFSFGKIFNDRSLPIVFDEGHGRNLGDEAVDVSRTVGWFTVLLPILVMPKENGTIVDMIRRVKDFRRTLAGHEVAYFRNKVLRKDNTHTKNFPVEILFNFFGQYQQLERADAILQQVPNGITEDLGRQALDVAIFEVSVLMERSRLRFTMTHGRKLRHQPEIQKWVAEFASTIESAVIGLKGLDFEYTLSDFPMLALDYQTLNTLVHERLSKLDKSGPTEIEDIYPCTPMQDGILASQASNPSLYRSSIRWMIEAGEGAVVDGNLLLEAWSQVVRRHSILRTAFIQSVSLQSLFSQVVFKSYKPRASLIHCGQDGVFKPLQGREALESASIHEHEFTIYRTGPSTAFCQLAINHALFDGASVQVLVRDLALAYKNALIPKPGPLYKDYVLYVSQRSSVEDQEYWGKYLTGCPSCYIPCCEGRQTDYAEQAISMEPSLVQKIREFCVQRELTTANVFQLAWALVLRTFTDSNSVCFGCLTSGRDVPVDGILDAVGAFMNMLVCRFDMVDEEPLIKVLEASKNQFRQSLEHQHMPLAEVHRTLGLQGQHLFNTAISFQTSGGTLAIDELQIQQLPENDPSEYDLTLNVVDSPAAVDVAFRYWKSRLPDGQIRFIGKMFAEALSVIVNDPDQSIRHAKISDARCDVIFDWNKNIPSPTDRCLHQIFQSMAERRPDDEAVYSSQESWTFKELDSMSSVLAIKLTTVGVGPEVLVPICFEKSIWAIVAMLGILKAGGGFVPLDPKHPPQRHLAIIEDIKAHLVLGSASTSASLRSYVPTVLEVGREAIDWNLSTQSIPPSKIATPSNVAYIIFTSGSTGKPKGVVIEHRAVSSSCTEHAKPMGFEASSRVLQFSSYTFDAAIAEIFTTLITGGTVCVPTDRERMGNIVRFINEARVNWVFSTPSFIRTVKPMSVPTVRTLAVGGEILGQDILATWTPHVTFIHVYGPTECCIFSVSHTVNRDEGHRVILGRAFGSVSWIVDPNNPDKLAPLGSVGELLLQGPILAREYLNNPEKTAEAFIDSPAWLPGECQRMYRTGDLVRYNADGTMMYIGRKDNQVKLRGQRLELGEIEYNMSLSLPERTAVAVELVDRAGTEISKALAAFVCHDAGRTDTISDEDLFDPMTGTFRSQMKDLRQKLERALPAYMVPSIYIQLKKMPPTPTGKLDRQLLRRLVANLSQKDQALYSLTTDEPKDGPTTDNERTLQVLWGKVLRMEASSIGAESNFFHLGGDSIAALHLVNLVRDQNLSIEIPQIFRNPTLREMSLCLEAGKAPDVVSLEAFALVESPISAAKLVAQAAEICQVQSESIVDIYPCTPLQEGVMALSIKKPGAYVSQFVFRLPEHINTNRFKDAWSIAVSETPTMRTRIIAIGSSVWQVVISESIQWEDGDSLQTYLAQDKKLELTPQSRLSRYALIQEGASRYFVFTAHHSVYDGWSLSHLFRKVERIYHQDPNANQLHPDFNTFIEHISGIDKKKSRDFWSTLLTGAKQARFPQLPNPGYYPTVNKSVHLPVDLGAESQGDFTTSTILQAAWTIILSQYTESTDVTFGTVVTGRNAPVPAIMDILGPTVATVPVRVKLDRSQPIAKLLHTVQDQATQRIPFEQEGLQNISRFSADARAACQFLSLFVVQPLSAIGGTILGSERVEVDYNSARATPLTIECSIGDGMLEISAHFDSNLISEPRMELIMHQFAHTFKEISANLQRSLQEITRCSNYEKQLIKRWNEKIPPAMETCVHHLFKKQALSWPKAPAIHAWDHQLTYAEVDQYAMAFAHHISQFRVGPEVLVPVVMDKSAWTIVAMIGILKAGGACAALDPSHPSDRLSGIIQDTGSPVIVVSPHYEDRFAGLVDKTIAVSKALLDELPVQTEDPETAVHYNNPAFVIFTSGSTGKPKGIVIEHVHICTSSEAHGSAMNVGLDSRVFSFASYAFDVSLGDTWTTLMRGGCVCVPSEEDRMNHLAQTVTEMRTNWIGLTPTVARLLTPESVPTVKTLSLGGEPMAKEDIATWADHVRLINFCKFTPRPYECGHNPTFLDGPAETVIGAMMSDFSTDRSLNPRTLGHGLDANLWVVNPDNHDILVPIGTIGELLIQGPAISRGYLKDPEKTAKSYLSENPAFMTEADFGSKRTQRIFKTGDLVFQNPEDGALVYIGRKDTQVKLHGQRIELQEIEEHLAANGPEDIDWAVELIQGSEPASACLAAFYASHEAIGRRDIEVRVLPIADEMRVNLAILEKRLASLLPKYMVPSAFVPLTTMPLNTSGKKDRLQLRSLGATILNEAGFKSTMLSENASKQKRVKRQPATKQGQKMQKLWSRILKLPLTSIGSLDDFFDLGGNSILAMKLAASAHADGLSLSVADIFKYPRLDDVSKLATGLKFSKALPRPISKLRMDKSLHRSVVQQLPDVESDIQYIGEATDYQAWTAIHGMTLHRAFYNHLFVDFDGPVDVSRMMEACHILIRHNPILRAAFVGHENRILVVGFNDVALDFQRFTWNDETDTAAPLSWELETIRLGKPPVRFALVERPNAACRLVIHISHAQYDGISVPLMLDDLKIAYTSLIGTRRSNFFDFLHENASRDNTPHLAFWSDLLHDSSMTQVVSHKGLRHSGPVDSSLSRTIDAPALRGRTGVTAATIFKAAWALVLSTLSGNRDITFGHITAGRNAYPQRFDSTIGAFLNITPVRAKLDNAPDNQTSLQFMHSLHDQYIDSLPHECVGWRTIIKSCTSWPSWTSFSSIVQHQNLDDISKVSLPGVARVGSSVDVWLLTTPCGESTEVQLYFSSHIPQSGAQAMLDMFCAAAARLCDPAHHETPVNDLLQSDNILIPFSPLSPNTDYADCPSIPETREDEGEDSYEFQSLRRVVENAWEKVLASLGAKKRFSLSDSYLDLGGDLVTAGLLAHAYQSEGYERVTVEDMMDYTTVRAQMGCLARGGVM